MTREEVGVELETAPAHVTGVELQSRRATPSRFPLAGGINGPASWRAIFVKTCLNRLID
jgi:hypothetical protein